jgi:hypothetical protein
MACFNRRQSNMLHLRVMSLLMLHLRVMSLLMLHLRVMSLLHPSDTAEHTGLVARAIDIAA